MAIPILGTMQSTSMKKLTIITSLQQQLMEISTSPLKPIRRTSSQVNAHQECMNQQVKTFKLHILSSPLSFYQTALNFKDYSTKIKPMRHSWSKKATMKLVSSLQSEYTSNGLVVRTKTTLSKCIQSTMPKSQMKTVRPSCYTQTAEALQSSRIRNSAAWTRPNAPANKYAHRQPVPRGRSSLQMVATASPANQARDHKIMHRHALRTHARRIRPSPPKVCAARSAPNFRSYPLIKASVKRSIVEN